MPGSEAHRQRTERGAPEKESGGGTFNFSWNDKLADDTYTESHNNCYLACARGIELVRAYPVVRAYIVVSAYIVVRAYIVVSLHSR